MHLEEGESDVVDQQQREAIDAREYVTLPRARAILSKHLTTRPSTAYARARKPLCLPLRPTSSSSFCARSYCLLLRGLLQLLCPILLIQVLVSECLLCIPITFQLVLQVL